MGTHKDFEKMLADYCAPTLAGKKPASLVSFDKNELDLEKWFSYYQPGMKKRGIYFFELCDCGNRKLVLIYHREFLIKTLEEPNIRSYLYGCGYANTELENQLCYLAERVQQCREFPHEIGLFLGYPVADVLGFIQNNGRNYKLSGQWKVYSDEKKAKRLFEHYAFCKQIFYELIETGKSIMCYE